MTTLIDPALVDRLAKICGMFGSAHHGERAAAAAKADSLVRSAGLTWSDLINLPTAPSVAPDIEWNDVARWCRENDDGRLSSREREFVVSMMRWRGEPTEKQAKWLSDIARRLAHEETVG